MSDIAVERLNAALTGRYEIERKVGEGGMASVYLAKDLKHNRSVALKVLKPELAAVVGADRFLAEIETTANLQHPNILPLYDSGEADSFLYYVMPFVEGESLRDRLDGEKQLPVDEAVRIATAVANALDFAHAHGVVHRDIKPGNILFQAGQPVVGDFGIALAAGAGGGTRLTETGLSLGTPYYMSPEQATGDQNVGGRSDIYSLGCVLYEMLVGDPPYMGSSAQAVLSQIISGKPVAATEKRAAVPAHVDAVIRKALEKVAADRFTTAGAFAAALNDSAFRYGDAAPDGATGGLLAWKIAAGVSTLVAILALAWAILPGDSAVEHAGRRIRLELPRPIGQLSLPQLSPDGARVAWSFMDPSVENGDTVLVRRLWLQSWNGLPPTPVPDTEGAYALAFSPDGQQIAFLAGNQLKIVDIDEPRPRTILSGFPAGALAWGDDGFIYASFNSTQQPTVVRVAESSGEIEDVTTRVPGWTHRSPVPLPEGRGVLFISETSAINYDADSVAVVDLANGEQRILVQGSRAWYSPSGHLVYRAGPQILAAPFDLETLELTGNPTVIADDIVAFLASAQGSLIYVEGTPAHVEPEAVWVHRDGTETVVDWRFDPGYLPEDPVLSPDGTLLALAIAEGDSNVVHVRNLVDGTTTRLGRGYRLAWSADSREVGFNSLAFEGDPENTERMYRQRADGSRAPTPISVPMEDARLAVGRWSLDQPFIHGTPTGLAVLMPGDSVASVILDGQGPHDNPTLSPDGRWVAFATPVSGEYRIFVRPWPDVGSALYPISLGEARDAQWSLDGKTLYYDSRIDSPDIVAARLQTDPGFRVLSREVLVPFQRGFRWSTSGWLFTVAHDEERVLISRWRVDPAVPTGVVLADNFAGELRLRLGEGN